MTLEPLLYIGQSVSWNTCHVGISEGLAVQKYLAHKKLPPARTLEQDYAWGPMVTLGGGCFL